jgi:hypothetical protein
MIDGSFWRPTSAKRGILLAMVLAMIVLHQSGLFGITESTALLFGWLPAQLAYDIAFNLVGVGILYAMYRAAPEPPAEYEPTMTDRDRGPTTETERPAAEGE